MNENNRNNTRNNIGKQRALSLDLVTNYRLFHVKGYALFTRSQIYQFNLEHLLCRHMFLYRQLRHTCFLQLTVDSLYTCQVSGFRRESHGFGNEITVSRWLRNFSRISIIKKIRNKYYGFMDKSVKPLVCVLVVSDLLLATWILTQNNRYPVSM